MTPEEVLRAKWLTFSDKEKENLFINAVKMISGGEVPEDTGCCPAGTCGVCVGGACLHCSPQ